MDTATASNRFSCGFVRRQDLDIGVQCSDLRCKFFRRLFVICRLRRTVTITWLQQHMRRIVPGISANLTPASDGLICIEIWRFNQDTRSNRRKLSGKFLVRLTHPVCAFGATSPLLFAIASKQNLWSAWPSISTGKAFTIDWDFRPLIM